MDVLEYFSRDFSLSNKIADPNNWEWEDRLKNQWRLAGETWQQFNEKWYGKSDSFGVDERRLSLEPIDREIDPGLSSMFVRECYPDMFKTVWALAIAKKGKHAVDIVGQRGTGKTLFIFYLLVRLLQLKQVVLYSTDYDVHLFYHDGVYEPRVPVFDGTPPPLPHPVLSSDVFIWSLVDIMEQMEPQRLFVRYPCFPVQTMSPETVSKRVWNTHPPPLITGFPLCTDDELTNMLPYQSRYKRLREALTTDVHDRGTSVDQQDPLSAFPGSRELLQECYGGGDSGSPSPDRVVDYLLGRAIDRFGYAPRKVFTAVFNWAAMTQDDDRPLYFTYPELRDAALGLSQTPSIGTHSMFNSVLVISPRYDKSEPFAWVSWDVDFISDWTARKSLQEVGSVDDSIIYQDIEPFRHRLGTRNFAKRFVATLVHHSICNTRTPRGTCWPLSRLVSDSADPCHFHSDGNSPASSTVRFPKVKRGVYRLSSVAFLSSCLKHNAYYILTDPMFPWFDAFTIELNRAGKSAILWVIQVTTSRRDGGSDLGYQKIREIVTIIKDETRGEPPLKKRKSGNDLDKTSLSVQVRYILAVPRLEDDSHFGQPDALERHFPKGWNENNDYRGDVYCLDVPLE